MAPETSQTEPEKDEETELGEDLDEKKGLEQATGILAITALAVGAQSFGKLSKGTNDISTETLTRLGKVVTEELRQEIVQQVLIENLEAKRSTAIEGVIEVTIAVIIYIVRHHIGKRIHEIEARLTELKESKEKAS